MLEDLGWGGVWGRQSVGKMSSSMDVLCQRDYGEFLQHIWKPYIGQENRVCVCGGGLSRLFLYVMVQNPALTYLALCMKFPDRTQCQTQEHCIG